MISEPIARRHVLTRRLTPGLALVLAACAGVRTPAPPPSGPAPAPAPAAPAAPARAAPTEPAPTPPTSEVRSGLAEPLAVEQKWLNSFFAGTPVQIAQGDDGSLQVDVPLPFCFEPGGSTVKPALAKVLDKVAESLRRRPAARLVYLAAPADSGGSPALALQRAGRVQGHLRERGVARTKLGTPSSTTVAAVQLRITAPATAP